MDNIFKYLLIFLVCIFSGIVAYDGVNDLIRFSGIIILFGSSYVLGVIYSYVEQERFKKQKVKQNGKN